MPEQLDLRFAHAAAPDDAGVRELVGCLAGRGWLNAAQIGAALSWPDRKVRALAAASDEVISYPGSPGYKLLRDCSRAEYERFRNASRSQARQMISRVIRCDRRFFARAAAAL